MYFEYGEKELAVLRRDKRMCEVIDRVGHIYRDVDGDIFSSVVHHIIGQQISTKAQATVWQRMRDDLGEVNAETILAAGVPRLQSMGMTYRKAEYINIFSYDDLAIQRGLRMLYRHRSIDRVRFEKYRRRFSPYCSVASLYLWAVSGGAIPELTDPAPKNK